MLYNILTKQFQFELLEVFFGNISDIKAFYFVVICKINIRLIHDFVVDGPV